MQPVTVSILIPLYNEEVFVATVLERVTAANASLFADAGVTPEVIVVDDGSTDNSHAEVQAFIRSNPNAAIRLIRHSKNCGKGAAVRTALQHAQGEFSIIQDADCEYNPAEYPALLTPLLADEADAVFGSRFLPAGQRRVLYFWHAVANRILTTIAGMASDLNLSDVETGFKAFRTALVRSIPLRSDRFGIEPELTIKLAKRRARVYEVPITYRGRTYEEGKKVRGRDAIAALGTILRSWLSNDIYPDPGKAILGAMANAQRFNNWMADTVMPFVGSEVLEIGAGIGNLTKLLCSRRARYVATDIDAEALMHLKAQVRFRRNLTTAVCDLSNSRDFAPFLASFDTVACLNVLEHLEDDLSGLRNIYNALRTGGRAVILVPQDQNIFGTLDEALKHHRRYSVTELKEKMSAAGFRVELIFGFNRVTYPGWFLNGRILRRRSFSRMQLAVFDALVPLWRRIDRFLPWPPTSLIAIGVRKGDGIKSAEVISSASHPIK
jgi:glycosyltransferase involved in cell wall biosynthesis